jgi:hypothetical protein
MNQIKGVIFSQNQLDKKRSYSWKRVLTAFDPMTVCIGKQDSYESHTICKMLTLNENVEFTNMNLSVHCHELKTDFMQNNLLCMESFEKYKPNIQVIMNYLYINMS